MTDLKRGDTPTKHDASLIGDSKTSPHPEPIRATWKFEPQL